MGRDEGFNLALPVLEARLVVERHAELIERIVAHRHREGELSAFKGRIDDAADVANVDAALEAELVARAGARELVDQVAESAALVVRNAENGLFEQLSWRKRMRFASH